MELWGVVEGRGWPRGEAASKGEGARGEPGVMGAPMGVEGPEPEDAAFISFLYLLRRFWNQILIWGGEEGEAGYLGYTGAMDSIDVPAQCRHLMIMNTFSFMTEGWDQPYRPTFIFSHFTCSMMFRYFNS